jgi:hypothetical protein
MALPASGNSLSISQINTEFGRASNTADTSLANLSTGFYATINLNSTSYPDATPPHAMSEFYSYNHSASSPPSLTSVSQYTVSYPDCGVDWIVNVSWYTSNADDTNYKVQIKLYGSSTVVADNQSTSSSNTNINTGWTGDATQSTYTNTARYRVEIVRLSDSAVIAFADTTGETVSYGNAC